METENKPHTEWKINEGDYVLFLEHFGMDKVPSIDTTSVILGQAQQVYANQEKVKIKNPDKNINGNSFINSGSTVGFVRATGLVPASKMDIAEFVNEDEKIDKGQTVLVKVAEVNGKAIVVNGITDGYSSQLRACYTLVENQEGLVGRIKVGEKNVMRRWDETPKRLIKLEAELSGGLPGYYNQDELIRIASKEPDTVEKYLILMKQTGKLHEILKIIDRSPMFANRLFGVFKENPDLIDVYALAAAALPKIYPDPADDGTRVSDTRVLALPETELVHKNVEKVKNLTQKLQDLLGDKDYTSIANPFDGLAVVRLQRLDKSGPMGGGIYMTIISTQNDFPVIVRVLGASGIIDSSNGDFHNPRNFGYLFASNYELDEEAFFNALVKHPFGSEELNKALEESGSNGKDYGRFAKYVFGEK